MCRFCLRGPLPSFGGCTTGYEVLSKKSRISQVQRDRCWLPQSKHCKYETFSQNICKRSTKRNQICDCVKTLAALLRVAKFGWVLIRMKVSPSVHRVQLSATTAARGMNSDGIARPESDKLTAQEQICDE